MNAEQVPTKILDSILNDVQVQAEKELADVKDEFLKKLAQQREELLSEAEMKLGTFQAELQLANERARLELELEIKKKRFEVIDSIVSDIVERLKDKLRTLRKTTIYEEALKRCVEKALKYTAETDLVIEGNAEDKPLLRRIAKALKNETNINIAVSDENIDTVGGLFVKTRDGTFTYLSTIEVRLGELKEDLRKMVLEKLSVE